MPELCNKVECTGCGACYNICPKNAIEMKSDECGFYKPVIDKEKCINCGLCEKNCPVVGYKSQNNEKPKVYAVQNKNDEQRYKSASGGAFSLFAKYVINQGGVVFGVVWDENIVAIHKKAETTEELEKMYSSKYVQSNTKNTFKETKEFLDKGRLVLYSGTPCQIAGLKSYLKKDYDNLITIDLVCHGVPSPLVFERYKKELSNKKIISLNMRSKKNGWGEEVVEIKLCNNDVLINPLKNAYSKLFLSDLSTNSACYNCRFNCFPRVADLTLGDFWGVDEYDKSLNDNKGLSIVLINSDKGKNIFEKVKNNCISNEIPLDVAIKCNPNIIGSSKPHKKREEFFEDIKNDKSLKYCVKKYCKTPLRIALYRLLPQFAKNFIKYKILKMEKR